MDKKRIEALLPEIVRRTLDSGSPLAALLGVMESLHEPSEVLLASIEENFDPYRARDAFVPYLARWTGLDWLLRREGRPHEEIESQGSLIEIGRLRELVSMASVLSQWRGTHRGLLAFLRTATGHRGFEIVENVDPGGHHRPFFITVRCPEDALAHQVLIQRIVEHQRPAYVDYRIEFGTEK